MVAQNKTAGGFFSLRAKVSYRPYWQVVPFAGDHRTDQGASAASNEASRSDEFLEGGNVVKVNAPDFHGETGGELYFAAAKFLSGLSQDGGLLRSDLAVDCNHPGVEQIGAFVVQEAQSF